MKNKKSKSVRFLFKVNLTNETDQAKLSGARSIIKSLNKMYGLMQRVHVTNMKNATGDIVHHLDDAVTASVYVCNK